MTDKIASAYLAMRRPKRFPVLNTVFGTHSNKQLDEVFIMKEYSQNDPYTKSPELADKVHAQNKMKEELREVREYSIHSTAINSALHENHAGQSFDPELAKHAYSWQRPVNAPLQTAKSIDSYLTEHKSPEAVHVYTGLQHSPFKNPHIDGGNFVAHLPAFTSSSTNFKKALGFSSVDNETKHDKTVHGGAVENGYHVLKIHAPAGTELASIRHMSANPEEDEMLINRGYDITINPRPVLASGESNRPVYVWSASLTKRRPKPIQS